MNGPPPSLGSKVWCLSPSDESRGYGHAAPVWPWPGKVTSACGHTLAVSRFDAAADGPGDTDPNATATVGAAEVFATEADALRAYARLLGERAEATRAETHRVAERLAQLETPPRDGATPMSPPAVTPVAVDPAGRLYRPDGSPVEPPGLGPGRVLRALADIDAGRYRPLRDVVAGMNAAGPTPP